LHYSQAEKKDVEFLSNAATQALGLEEQAGTLFRGNSLASKAIDHVCLALSLPLLKHSNYS
jgi:hypothetical protein